MNLKERAGYDQARPAVHTTTVPHQRLDARRTLASFTNKQVRNAAQHHSEEPKEARFQEIPGKQIPRPKASGQVFARNDSQNSFLRKLLPKRCRLEKNSCARIHDEDPVLTACSNLRRSENRKQPESFEHGSKVRGSANPCLESAGDGVRRSSASVAGASDNLKTHLRGTDGHRLDHYRYSFHFLPTELRPVLGRATLEGAGTRSCSVSGHR